MHQAIEGYGCPAPTPENSEIFKILAYEQVRNPTEKKSWRRDNYHYPIYDLKEYERIRTNIELLSQDAEALELFKKEEALSRTQAYKTGIGIKQGLQHLEEERKEELAELRRLRINDLKAYLVRDKYDEDLLGCFSEKDWLRFPEANLPKRMSSQEYEGLKTHFASAYEASIQSVECRAEEIARRAFKAKYDTLRFGEEPYLGYHPSFSQTLASEEVKRSFEAWVDEKIVLLIKRAKRDIKIPHSLLDVVSGTVTKIQATYEENFRKLLPGLSDNSVALRLATSVFSRCNSNLPGVAYSFDQLVCQGVWFDESTGWASNSAPIADTWAFNKDMSCLIAKVVEACGSDVSTCTYLDLETRDPPVICMTCRVRNPEIMMWQQMLFHWLRVHGDVPVEESLWRVATDAERASAMRNSPTSQTEDILYRCLLCPPNKGRQGWAQNMANHLEHVQNGHSKDGISSWRTYLRAPETRQRQPLLLNVD